MQRLLLRRIRDSLLSFIVMHACAAWLIGAILLELQVHRSKLLGVVSALPACAFALWATRREGGSRLVGALRAAGLLAVFVVVLLLMDHTQKDKGAWAIWVPLMTIDFTPSILIALPSVAIACFVGSIVSHAAIFARWGRGSYAISYTWPLVWLFVAFTGFYRATFDRFDPAGIGAQPGVKLLAPSGAQPCGFFASRCNERLFPRGVGIDARTRTMFASFGSTSMEVSRGLPKLLAVRLDGSSATWMGGTSDANEIRNVFVDEAARRVIIAQWGSNRVAVYDTDDLRMERTIAWPFDVDEYQPIQILADGDRVFVVHIWFPRVVELSLESGSLTRFVDLYDEGVVGNGVQLGGGAISTARNRLYVTVGHLGNTVIELDLATLKPLRQVALDAKIPASIAFDDAAGRLYTTSFHGSTVEVVDVDTMQKVDELPGATGARELAIDPSRGLLFVMDYVRGRVLFVSLRDRKIVREVAVGPKPGGAAVLDDRLYVSGTLGVVSVALD